MASFKKEGDSWLFVLDLPRDPVTNERRQKKRRGFKTKKEAQAAASALYTELTKGTHVEELDISFEDFASMWLDEYARNAKVSSVRVRKHQMSLLLTYFKKIPVKKITKQMYQNAMNEMKKSGNQKKNCGLADNTIEGAHGTGRMIFQRAVELDVIKVDPTVYTKLPKTKKTVEELEQEEEVPKYLEKEELALFLKTAQINGLEGDYEMFLTLAYSGIRTGELVVLREADVDFKESTISVTKTYYNPNNNAVKYQLLTPKTMKSKRTIDMEPIVMKAIEKYIKKLKQCKMLYRDTYYDKGYVFPNTNEYPGYPNFVKTVENRMARLLKIAGLNTALTPHSLRHTHTSLLAETGEVSLTEIMDRLGHKDDKTTRLVYTHVTKTRKKEASRKFGELMRNLEV